MSNNSDYIVQYAAPQQQNPPAYEDVELTDYEMATLLSASEQPNPNVVYYNPVETINSQYAQIPVASAPNAAYSPNYATPVIVNNPTVIVQPATVPVSIPNQNVSVCHRRWGCRSNLTPHEYRVCRSAAFLKFHLFMLMILAIIGSFLALGDVNVWLIMCAHVLMLVCGLIASSRRSIPVLVLLLIWLMFTLIICCIQLAHYARNNSTCIGAAYFGINIFFMFVSFCNTISLLSKIKCSRAHNIVLSN